VAQRLVEPERTSPAAKTPGTVVPSRCAAPAAAPVRMKPWSSRAIVSSSRSVHGSAPKTRNRNENRQALAGLERHRLELTICAVERGDLAAVAHHHCVALELLDEVIGHRLPQVGPAMQQGDQRAAPSEPHGGLAGRVASADDGHALGSAELRLGWAGGVKDADALVLVEVVDGQAPVLRAGGDQDRSGSDFAILPQLHDVAPVAGLERDRTIRRRQARVELSRLGDGAARELVACYPRREAEVILDPPRRTAR
jgi:hypothetical protein